MQDDPPQPSITVGPPVDTASASTVLLETFTPHPNVSGIASATGAFERLGLDSRGTIQWNGGDNFSYFGHDWADNEEAQFERFDDPELAAAVRDKLEPEPGDVTQSGGAEQDTEERPRNTTGGVVTEPSAPEDTGEDDPEDDEEGQPSAVPDYSETTSDDIAEAIGLEDQSSPPSLDVEPSAPAAAPATGQGTGSPSFPPSSPGAQGIPGVPSGPVVPAGPGTGGANVPAPGAGGGSAVGEWWDGLSTGQQVAVGAAAAVGVVIVGVAIAYVGGMAALATAGLIALRFAARFIARGLSWLARRFWQRFGPPIRRGVERIRKWIRRRLRSCKRRSPNPVHIDDGTVTQEDPSFTVEGLISLTITSTYQSDIHLNGPLGWGRVSDIDATLERLPDSKLRYRDGAGYYVDFHRPTPNLGHWQEGDHVRRLEIAAGERRSFMIREAGIIKYFAKHKDGVWRICEISDRNANSLLFERNASGDLTAIEMPEGLRFEFHYALGNRLRTSVDLVGRDGACKEIMRYAYDGAQNLIRAEAPFGDLHEYKYDERHLRVWARINGQYEGNYTFDAQGRCVFEQTNGPNNGTRFEYNPELKITKVVPSGDTARTEIYYYDDDGTVFGEGHISGRLKWTYYDEAGNIARVQDGNGHSMSYGYDNRGNITRVTDPEGRVVDYRWTEDGQVAVHMDQDGAAWENTFDERGNLVASKSPDGFDTEFKVGDAGQVTGICRSDGLIKFLTYDDGYWLTSEVDFDGLETRIERDSFGRVLSATEGGERKIIYEYEDQEGLDFWAPTRVFLDKTRTHQIRVDLPRRKIAQIDGSGRESSVEIDAFGKVEKTTDAQGGALSFRYNLHEELVAVKNQTGQEWTFERDDFGRVVRETDFGGQVIEYSYDDGDRLVTSTHSDGTKFSYDMDKSALLKRETVQAPGQSPLITDYTYDSRALLETVRNADAAVSFERDIQGQVTAEIVNGSRIDAVYDCCGNRTERRRGGDRALFKFDPVGRLKELEVSGHASLIIGRDSLGHETERSSAAGFAMGLTFEPLGLLKSQTLKGGKLARNYSWNASLEPTEISDSRWGKTRYQYDANGQVIATDFGDTGGERFSYDRRLNITQAGTLPAEAERVSGAQMQNWSKGEDGRVTHAVGPNGEQIALTYDPRGRVVQKTVHRDGFRPQVWRFEWNGLDRMTAAFPPDATKWTYGYDAFGRRLWKQQWRHGSYLDNGIATIGWQKSVRHDFVWDRDVVASETITDGANVREVDWFFEPDSFMPIARREAGYLSYVVTDHLGTPREIVSETGEIEWAAELRTWGGARRLWHGSAVPATETIPDASYCPIRFQGQWVDVETGLHYNRLRYYDPTCATYLAPDPIGFVGGPLLYSYVKNPIVFTDPFGLQERFPSWMPTRRGYQRHHIIPFSLRNHPALRRLGLSFDINGATNMMYLPVCEGIHPTPRGLHRDWTRQHLMYNIEVAGVLTAIEMRARLQCWSKERVRRAVRNLQDSMRRQLANGSRSLAPPCR